MTYSVGGLVQATDFNTLVGGNPVTAPNTLNTVWATGGTNAGYGQTAVSQVSAGGTIAASDWVSLLNSTGSAASHQGTSILSVTTPVSGGSVAYQANIPTNLTSIYSSKLNAATQGTTLSNTVSYGSTWSQALTFTFTISFPSGDAARYFFNAGGQLKVTCAHANTAIGINLMLNQLASNIGTVVMSSPTSGTATISSVPYNGITKIGGGGATPTINTNAGYYAMNTSNTTLFSQTVSTGYSSYQATNIAMNGKSNGTQGSNGDAGSVITLYATWDEIPNGLVVGTGTTTTVTVQVPETSYIANSWGAISISGTASGS